MIRRTSSGPSKPSAGALRRVEAGPRRSLSPGAPVAPWFRAVKFAEIRRSAPRRDSADDCCALAFENSALFARGRLARLHRPPLAEKQVAPVIGNSALKPESAEDLFSQTFASGAEGVLGLLGEIGPALVPVLCGPSIISPVSFDRTTQNDLLPAAAAGMRKRAASETARDRPGTWPPPDCPPPRA
jgi:hypothetical protein